MATEQELEFFKKKGSALGKGGAAVVNGKGVRRCSEQVGGE